MKFIAENEKFKVYSIYESIYLKKKAKEKNNDHLEKDDEDEFIGWHYGDPNDGILTESYAVVSGCGITIYDLKKGRSKHFFEDDKNRLWTNAIHQDEFDDYHTEFRFVAFNSKDELRVFKMNFLTAELTELN